jgi:uncharacterized Fe-S cluster-containing radical SAM superfamily protein
MHQNNAQNEPHFPHPLESLFVSTTSSCNLRCVFCAYARSTLPRQVMPFDDFLGYIEQATEFGYRTFNLTPHLGEPLTDPLFLERLRHLEEHPGVDDFYFSTNLTLANEGFFSALAGLHKLRWLSISVYGHDEDSFASITRRGPRLYQRLVQNLQLLLEQEDLLPRSELKVRTVHAFDLAGSASELSAVVRQLEEAGMRVRVPPEFSNWSGLVGAQELQDLSLQPRQRRSSAGGPCVFLFYKPVVLPDGTLNACSAADGNATLRIGNLKQNDFASLLSSANAPYMEILEGHLGGEPPAVCRPCTAYRGITEPWYAYQFHKRETVTLHWFMEWLRENARRANEGDGGSGQA